jgi:hypothetical protein
VTWTINYVKFYKEKWENWAMEEEMDSDESLHNHRLRSDAPKQTQTWDRLEPRVHDLFHSNLGDDL